MFRQRSFKDFPRKQALSAFLRKTDDAAFSHSILHLEEWLASAHMILKEWTEFRDLSFPYITGHGFACHCRHVLNYDGFKKNPYAPKSNWYFVKTDHLSLFFNRYAPKVFHYVLFTHNSDFPIDEQYRKFLDQRNLHMWFALNPALRHEKLRAIPIGIANPGYSHGRIDLIRAQQNRNVQKTNIFYANYTIRNNEKERRYCLEQTGISPATGDGWNGFAGGWVPRTFEQYLSDLASSYFCISPNGNGTDTHRIWEALYLKTIPVVTRSVLTDHHGDFPIIVLNDWSEFININFSPTLYETVWSNWNLTNLRMDRYLERVQRSLIGKNS